MKLKAIILLALFSFTWITASVAQNRTDTLKPTDVLNMSLEDLLSVKINVSTTVPTDVFNTPSTVSVIDRELIDQYNFLTVAEAVKQVAGVDILQSVIDKNIPTIRGILQNFYANKVLIMINNIPVWNPTYGNSTLDRVSINSVERIEILKGSASVLYGTNAYTGVINIILRSPKKSNLTAELKGGHTNFGAADLYYAERKGDFSWNISGSNSLELRAPLLINGANDPDTNIIAGNEFLHENDTQYYYNEELRRKTLNINLSYKSHSLFFNNYINSYTNPGVFASYKTGANQSITDRGSLVSYSFAHDITEKIHFLYNSHFDYHYRNQIMSQAIASSARFSSYRLASITKLNYILNQYLKFEVGGEIYLGGNLGHEIISMPLDTVLSENIKGSKRIVEGSGFAQVNLSYKRFNLLAGLRNSHNNNFGNDLSPRITGLFAINSSNSIKAVYGHSFRTPNLLELYFDHWSIKGNPNLKPEKHAISELVYTSKINNFYGQITAYHSYYTNLIHRVKDTLNPTSSPTYENASEFEGFGVETELRYQAPNIINAFINYNYNTGNKKGINENFKYIPEHTIAIGINKPIQQFFISANAYAYSSTQGNIKPIPEQLSCDFHLGYNHQSARGFKLKHTVSFKNITNSNMLIPEYIRANNQVNTLSSGFGLRAIYSLKIDF